MSLITDEKENKNFAKIGFADSNEERKSWFFWDKHLPDVCLTFVPIFC